MLTRPLYSLQDACATLELVFLFRIRQMKAPAFISFDMSTPWSQDAKVKWSDSDDTEQNRTRFVCVCNFVLDPDENLTQGSNRRWLNLWLPLCS